MSRLNFDLNSIALETIELTKNLRRSSLFEEDDTFDFSRDHLSQENDFDFEEEESIADEVPESTGLLFTIDKGISTFCIRAFVSDDLSWDMEAIKRNDPQLIKALRLKEDWCLEDISYFPTLDTAMAETLYDQMINRRFPRHEAVLCNLSDPGFSWWMKEGKNSFEIYYQSHGIERDESLVQLGPLGDPLIAFRRFSKSLSIIRNLFSVNEFSSTEKAFILSSTSENDIFDSFKRLFIEGEFEFEEVIPELKGDSLVLFLYLRELSMLRSFWLKIQSQLSQA